VLGNYTITSNTAIFTITPKAASVTPAAKSKIYGATDPALTGTLSGFLAGDSVTAAYSRTPGEGVGTYTISATLSPAEVLGNYTITWNTAIFTIRYDVCVLYDQTASHKKGSTIPIKLNLCNAAGVNISSAAIVLTATNIVPLGPIASPFLAEDSGNANSDSDFRYAGGFYIFNLSTKSSGFATGSWQMNFLVNGASDPSYALKFDIK